MARVCLELCESYLGSSLIGASFNLKEKDKTHQIARPRKKTKNPQLQDRQERSAVVGRAVNVVVCDGHVRGRRDAELGT